MTPYALTVAILLSVAGVSASFGFREARDLYVLARDALTVGSVVAEHGPSIKNRVRSMTSISPTDRDNIVVFTSNEFNLIDVEFVLRDFSIPNDQHAAGDLQKDKRYTAMCEVANECKLNFRVGRSASISVAKQFRELVPTSKNTFNDEPKDLNFFLVGDLRLIVKDEAGFSMLVAESVVIAQGNVFFRNNWWFGGSTCAYIGDHTVSCTAITDKGKDTTLLFTRGGGLLKANTIEVTLDHMTRRSIEL